MNMDEHGHPIKVDDETFALILEIQEKILAKTGYNVTYAGIIRKMFIDGSPGKVFGLDLKELKSKKKATRSKTQALPILPLPPQPQAPVPPANEFLTQ